MSSSNGRVAGVDAPLACLMDDTKEKLVVGPPHAQIKVAELTKSTPEIRRKKGSSLRQIGAAVFANLGTINTGLVFGFSAVALPQLTRPDSEIPIDENQASWLASMSSVSTPCGCILSGYLMDLIGRRRTLIVTEIPLIIGWILIGMAPNIWWMYVGRLLVGLGVGMVGAPSRVYTAEATQPHLRGILAALASVHVSLGVMIEYILGYYFSWSSMAFLNTLVPIGSLGACLLLPDSPAWLLSRGRFEDSKRSLQRLRGATCDVEHEMGMLVAFAQTNATGSPGSAKQTLRAILHPSARKPFLILMVYFAIYQFCGINPLTFYAVEVFQHSGSDWDKNVATIILGVVRLVFTIVGCLLMRRVGRRPLTFLSSIGCGVPMLGLGYYMWLKDDWISNGVTPKYQWFPVLNIFAFMAFSSIGYLVVPWVMIGEVFPAKVRGIIGGLTTCGSHFMVFVAVKSYPLMQKMLTEAGSYVFYGVISLLGTVYFYACLPETKGRSLQEIEDFFSGRRESLAPDAKRRIVNNNNNRPTILKPQKGKILP
ncbi:unnamed protein product [Bemisia tabaci]|uniref:Major facilitator superfamily (MFS) profile domain-containing protein n=1 Tax=Bemisia tabaci TaxID=7038 RepID=A0A9P0F2B0_BEMTA|nr:unnamed protein product [Bemisia tabaci]